MLNRQAASLLSELLIMVFHIFLVMLLSGVGTSSLLNSTSLEDQLFQYIDDHQDKFVQTLKEWVAVKSDSIQPAQRSEVIGMVKIAASRLQDLGANVTLVNMSVQQDLPVNLKFLIEGMEEAISIGLKELVEREKEQFFSNVDYIVISDNTWLSTEKPALTYGTRGNVGFSVEVQGGERDLHSGALGGIVQEPMSDLIALLDSLVDSSGHILIPGIYDGVDDFTEEEKKLYEPIEFDIEQYKIDVGVKKFLYDTKEEILSHLWRFPSLSIHGIEGAFHEKGIKTVIPSRVIGKFSIRQVPHMNLSTVECQVKQYLEKEFSKRNSPNKLTVHAEEGASPWITNISDPQYKAAAKAIKRVFKKDPDMIRDGSTIPIAQMLQDITKKSVMMFPIGAADDGEHSQKEKISRKNYIDGTKVFSSFLLEISKLHKELLRGSK
ncbi:beta-Ala-His dipeptidase-like isoform X3 [Podarcis raffonei]|uniref:beta-Ala-His dipeptidase-like isoform X3 n=1 Tax=Podarcis raffonei TaxID=65483 RepID=UPI002329111A|nr:beta-Ala-His dipeptidase-like isoform X3 [Podarcis raffonei]